MKITETNYNELKLNYENYINDSKKIVDLFGGPSLYFHERALQERNANFLSIDHIEMIYATLCSWGMHRMGNTHTKMVDFDLFKQSILKFKQEFTDLKELKLENIKLNDLPILIKNLSEICFNLKSSKSNSFIVGNSKTLAHILPNLVPPIDRQYTIRFFSSEPNTFYNEDKKLNYVTNFKNTLHEKNYFYHILDRTYDFINHIKDNDKILIEQPFQSSFPKIFDNLIISYVKEMSPI